MGRLSRRSEEEHMRLCEEILKDKIKFVKGHLEEGSGLFLDTHLKGLEALRDNPDAEEIWKEISAREVNPLLVAILNGLSYPRCTTNELIEELTELLSVLRKAARKRVTSEIYIGRSRLIGKTQADPKGPLGDQPDKLLPVDTVHVYKDILTRLVGHLENIVETARDLSESGITPLPHRKVNPERTFFIRSLVQYFWSQRREDCYEIVAVIAYIVLNAPEINRRTVTSSVERLVKTKKKIEKSPLVQEAIRRSLEN